MVTSRKNQEQEYQGNYLKSYLGLIAESHNLNLTIENNKITGYYQAEDLQGIVGLETKQENDETKANWYNKNDLEVIAQAMPMYKFEYDIGKRQVTISSAGKTLTKNVYSYDEKTKPENSQNETSKLQPSAPPEKTKPTWIRDASTIHGFPIYEYANPVTNTVTTIAKSVCFLDAIDESHKDNEANLELAKSFTLMRVNTSGGSSVGYRFGNDGWIVTISVNTEDFNNIKDEKQKQAAIDAIRAFCDISSALLRNKIYQEAGILFENLRETEGTCYAGGIKFSPESASLQTKDSFSIEQLESMFKMMLNMNLLDAKTATLIYTEYRNALGLNTMIPEFKPNKDAESLAKFKSTLRTYHYNRKEKQLRTKSNYETPVFGRLFGDSADVKLSAVEKLLRCYIDNKAVQFTEAEIKAARAAKLGKIVNANNEFLPEQFLIAEKKFKNKAFAAFRSMK